MTLTPLASRAGICFSRAISLRGLSRRMTQSSSPSPVFADQGTYILNLVALQLQPHQLSKRHQGTDIHYLIVLQEQVLQTAQLPKRPQFVYLVLSQVQLH